MFLLIRRCVHIAINGISRRYVPGPQFFPLALARAKAGVKVVDSAIVKGKKTSYEVRLALSQQGPVQLELIEYQSGDTVQKDFLDEKGEGIHHILFRVNDLEATLEKFAAQGVKVLQQDRFVGGGGLAYMGTDETGGIIMEVVQRPPHCDPEKGSQYVTE